MIKKKFEIVLILLLLVWSVGVEAQSSNHREEVFLHMNSDFLITGETLLFSAFCNSSANGEPSSLSKILYVELVDDEGEAVFQQKILLEDGRANGLFFLSSLVSTGRYQLLAYTRWMKNFDDYFKATITVVNPFENYSAPQAEKELKLSVHPEGGKLLPEKINLLIVQAKNELEQPFQVKGRVVSDDGEKLADVSGKGLIRLSLIPESTHIYQIILEDSLGNLSFFDLPVAKEGTIIQLRNQRDSYLINLPDTQEASYSLVITDGQNKVFSSPISSNNSLTLPKNILSEKTYLIQVFDASDSLISHRVFGHFDSLPEAIEIADSYQTRSLIEIPYTFPLASKISVSVRKQNRFDGHIPSSINPINNALQSNLDIAPLTDWEDLDNQMVLRQWKWDAASDAPDQFNLLPEVRGELISGKLSGQNISNQIIFYSLSGKDYQLYTAKSDTSGSFEILVDPPYEDKKAYLGILSEEENPSSIKINDPFLAEYPPQRESPIVLDSVDVADLVSRSIKNQIENAYYQRKLDSTYALNTYYSPVDDFNFFFKLDDYNRFPKLYEHFIEYVPAVMARKDRIQVLLRDAPEKRKPSVLLLDGVPVSTQKILEFSPYKIESMGIINTRYFMGPLVADGLISFHTFDKDLQGFPTDENTILTTYQGLQRHTQFVFPDYGKESVLKNIPDYRTQLFWDPTISTNPDEPYLLSFYTGDQTGTFEIVIEGYDDAGKPISILKTFEVRGTSLAERD